MRIIEEPVAEPEPTPLPECSIYERLPSGACMSR